MDRPTRLWLVLAADLALVGGLLVVGVVAHSLGVWAEGVDYLADAAAVGISLWAMHAARRTRARGGRSGVQRYAAAVNAGWLLVLNVAVAVAAVVRLAAGVHPVQGLPVLVVSAVAAVVMLAGALLLRGDGGEGDDDGEDLNVRAVLLDTAADAAAAGGVAVSGAVIWLTGGGASWLDPAAALVIAVVVGVHAVRLLGQVRRSVLANRPAAGPPGPRT